MRKIHRGLFLIFIMCLITSCSEKIFIYYSPGPLQILGNEKELYFFIDINRIAKRGYSVYDAPTRYPIGHIQDILVVNVNGLVKKTHVNIDKKKGVSFHPNNEVVFRYDKEFYIYSGKSQSYVESIYKWSKTKKRFILLPLEKSNAFLKKMGISEKLNYGEGENVVLSLSKKSGWNFYFSDTAMYEDEFTWNGIDFSVKIKHNKDDFNIIIDCAERRKGFPIILTYPSKPMTVDKKTFDSFDNFDYGHPKPWYSTLIEW